MAKFLVSSLTCKNWLEKCQVGDGEYEMKFDGKRLYLGIDFIECDGQGKPTSVTLTGKRVREFIDILKLLHDQPILLVMEDYKLWLWQCII